MALSLLIPAASAAGADYTYELLANGETETTVPLGDEVRVTLLLSKLDGSEIDLYSMQDYVCFDPEYLQFVEGSIETWPRTAIGGQEQLLAATPVRFSVVPIDGYNRVFVNRSSDQRRGVANGSVLLSFRLKTLRNGTTYLTHDTPELFLRPGEQWSFDTEDAIIHIGDSTPTPPPAPAKYTLTLDPGEGRISGRDPSGTYEAGSSVTLPGASRSGYSLDGWTDGTNTYYEGAAFPVGRDVTLTAVWSVVNPGGGGGGGGGGTPEEKVRLTLTKTEGSFVDKDPSGSYALGSKIQLPELRRDGYDFLGWSDGDSTYPPSSRYTLERDVTLTAVWKADVPGAFNGRDHIAFIMGFEDGTLRPNNSITRAQCVTMLYRLLDADVRDRVFTKYNSFSDVDESAWFNKAASSMARGGYVNGYTDGTFGGQRSITRAEFVAILVRMAGDGMKGSASFADVPDSYWAHDYIAAAAEAGWINGYNDGTFRPTRPISRVEVCVILNRVMNRGVDANSRLISNLNRFSDLSTSAWYYWDMIEATNTHSYIGTRPSEQWTGSVVDHPYDIAHYERPGVD